LIVLGLAGVGLPGTWRWAAGFLSGGCYAFWLVVRDSVPRHIEHWLDGANGERWTAAQLRTLEAAGWKVAHDLRARYGNVDHIVVGPAGVFLLDSKNWFGDVTVQDGTATITPKDNPDAAWSWPRLARALRGASAANQKAMESLTGVRAWVQPVVVVWAPFEQRCVRSAGVVYVAGEALADWLAHEPTRLSSEQISQLTRAVC
jgi:Nuclease-related domain